MADEEVVPQSPNAALRFAMIENKIGIWVFKPERFEKIGFGIYLKKIEKGEIEATQEAYDLIIKQKFCRGICPMEIFDGNDLAFCERVFSASKLSLHEGASKWFKECCHIVKE